MGENKKKTKCRKLYRAYSNLSDCQTNLLEEEKSSDGQTNLKKIRNRRRNEGML